MYTLTLVLHSLLRWVVVVAAIAAVVFAVRGWLGRRGWTTLDDRLGMIFTISMDLQLLLGLLLYVALSPVTRLAFQDFGAAMSNGAVRFFAVEHIAVMIVAVVLSHIGRARSRQAADAVARHRAAAIWFGLALVAMIAAIPWPFYSFGRPLLRLTGA